MRAVSMAAAVCLWLGTASMALASSALVATANATVYEKSDEASRVLGRLEAGWGANIENCDDVAGWCRIHNVTIRPPNGWIRADDVVRSEGVELFSRANDSDQLDYAIAEGTLRRELETTRDPVVACWLEFHIGHAQRQQERLEAAAATFTKIAVRPRRSVVCRSRT
jgi:hypothetical protein